MSFTPGRQRGWSLVAATLLLAGCGGSSPRHTGKPQPTEAMAPSAPSTLAELLSVPAVGRIYGRCKPGDRRWTIELAPGNVATDSITYRIGSAQPRTVLTGQGQRALTWQLVPGRFTSHEPIDPTSRSLATTIKTTAPISLSISQATEPRTYRVNVKFAVAAATDGTTHCALVATSLTAATYYSGGQPPS